MKHTVQHGGYEGFRLVISKEKEAVVSNDEWMKDEWQPIETAPKDEETEILIWTGISMYVATWSGVDDKWFASGLPFMMPTHWRPLPKPPSNG